MPDSVLIQTNDGPVHGLNGPVRVFRGIPYAQPPLGPLRWRAPLPPLPRSALFAADQFGDDFPQTPNPLFRAQRQSEDCLYLNIWSPEGASHGELPVMVWLHGGGFVSGSGSDVRCDGAAFAAGGAVVVTLNYRSGVFGFLAHPALTQESAHHSSGNYGLLDQIAALQWVQANIAAFGGSASRVTVFGVSAGSASIALLLTSPLAKGLFQQAILHSPGTCRPLAGLDEAERLGATLGKDIDDLRRLSAAELFAKTPLLVPKMRGLTTPRVLRPIRDGWVIKQDELRAFAQNNFTAMPILLGTNSDEGSKLTAAWTVTNRDQYHELLVSSFGELAAKAQEVYPVNDDSQVKAKVAEVFGDTQFNFGTWRLATAMAERAQPVYRYLFSRRRPGLADGPHHGEEVAYVFDTLALQRARGGFDYDAIDSQVAAAMNRAWLRFAKTGNPNGGDSPSWPMFTPGEPSHLVFGDRIDVGRSWRDRQISFVNQYSTMMARPFGTRGDDP